MRVIGVIPARYDSTRLPGKPLMKINGTPMIELVYKNIIDSDLDDVIVATDDQRIFEYLASVNVNVKMTSKEHSNGTSRIYEIADNIEADYIINIQGDEPLINNEIINKFIHEIYRYKDDCITMKKKIEDRNEIENINNVKVITDKDDFAIYFSRLPIPFERNCKATYFKHIGIYAYKKDFLERFIKMEKSELEDIESLEQLRILENGKRIKVLETDVDLHGVDTIEDIAIVERLMNK